MQPALTPSGDSPTAARRAGFAALLFALVLLAFLPALRAEFIWDDDDYVYDNPVLTSLDGLGRLWIPQVTPQYYPVVFTTFWIEHHLYPSHPEYGTHPLGYHLVNLLLHALNALLLWLVLRRAGVAWMVAWTIAAIFAVHPVHVESVAWVTERKNVLSLCFYLSAALAYLRFDRRRAGEPHPKGKTDSPWAWYALALLFFILALLSKSVTASLPVALGIVLLFKGEAITLRRIWPLVPMLVLGAIAGLHTASIERIRVGAIGPEWDFTFIERVLIASRAFLFYPSKIIAPHPLIFIYPRWSIDASSLIAWGWFAGSLALVIAVALISWKTRRRGPILALAFYAVTIFPALGFANIYPMKFSFVADHFQYHASIGMIALIVGGGAFLLRHAALRRAAVIITLALFTALSFMTTLRYHDAETLWRHTAQQNPSAWIAHTNLSRIMLLKAQRAIDAGDRTASIELVDEAERFARLALAARPDHASALTNLAEALRLQGEFDEAIIAMRRAIESDAAERAAYDEAGGWQQVELKTRSLGQDFALLGRLYELAERPREAEAAYAQSYELNPDLRVALDGLSRLAYADGRLEEAARWSRLLLERLPSHVRAMLIVAEHAQLIDRDAEAATWYRRAAETTMDSTLRQQAVYRLAWLLATSPIDAVRSGEAAREYAVWLVRDTGQASPYAFDALAAADAELGRFDDAVKAAELALQLAQQYELTDLAKAIEHRIEVYRTGEAWRDE